jgi:hypothetical protein
MSKTEVIAIMTAIRAAYPNYYKNQAEVNDAINLWAEMLQDDKADHIAKSVKDFIKNDSSGFPPTIGQIRSRARDIHIAELERRKRERDLLPEPDLKGIPMPDELREKFNAMLDRMKV